MDKKKSSSEKSSNGSPKAKSSKKNTMPASQLQKLFEDELKDIYWAEKALTKAIPKMIEHATSSELIDALTVHLEETQEQVNRLEQVFASIGKKAEAVKCEAMTGLIKEAEEIMEECEEGAMCDAGIISAGQKVEHYEIATYGGLAQLAKTLQLEDIAGILEETLVEEKAADEKLTDIAENDINFQAADETEEEA